NSFFASSPHTACFIPTADLSPYGRPADERERELLKPFTANIAPDILDGSYRLPTTDGSGRERANLRAALALLSEAGYDLDGNLLRQRSTRTPMTFEIMVVTPDQ